MKTQPAVVSQALNLPLNRRQTRAIFRPVKISKHEYATASAAVLHRALVRVLEITQRLDLKDALLGLVNAALGAKLEQLVQKREGLRGRSSDHRHRKRINTRRWKRLRVQAITQIYMIMTYR